MLHLISLGLALFGVWLLLSGFFEPLLIAFGIGSCLLVLWIAWRMDVVDHEGHPIHLGWRIIFYWVWLGWEIAKANVDVARRIIDPKLPIDPVLVEIKTSQKSELGQVIYANSITLTPGTVSVRVRKDVILVHAVAESLADDLAGGEMDRRVTAVEGLSGDRSRKGEAA